LERQPYPELKKGIPLALSHLIKHIYNNGTDEVIRRGKKIHSIGNVELVEHDELMGGVIFRVKDDSYSTFYKVYIGMRIPGPCLSGAVVPITWAKYAAMKRPLSFTCRIWWIKTC
jgi:hypothetical protein